MIIKPQLLSPAKYTNKILLTIILNQYNSEQNYDQQILACLSPTHLNKIIFILIFIQYNVELSDDHQTFASF